MTPSAIFLLQAFVIVAVPVALLRISGLKGLLPLVAVQIVVGIALGPSVFGRLAPDYFQTFAGPAALSSLSGLASVAVLIFGLVSGLHLDTAIFSGRDKVFWPTAIANVAIPLALGCLAGYWILARYPEELPAGVTPAVFMAAIAISVTMKALPVLGAILGEMDLLGRRIGNLALGVAGFNDIVLWIMLAGLLTAAAAGHAGGGQGLSPLYLLVLAPAYLLFMVRIVRPALGDMVKVRMRDEAISARALVVVGSATIASALTTELMGLHYIIGSFVVGAIMPANLRKPILDRLQVMTVALLMPFFFTVTGMRTLDRLEFAHIVRSLCGHHRGRLARNHWRHDCGRAAVRGKVVIWARAWIAAAGQRPDRIDRTDGSPRRWNSFAKYLRADGSHGVGLYGCRHAVVAICVGRGRRAAADRGGGDHARPTSISRMISPVRPKRRLRVKRHNTTSRRK